MDQGKTGRFIAQLRRTAGLTQQQLGLQLGVSNKTVSRWETGAYLPDVALLRQLAQFFGVSLEELLQGARSPVQRPGAAPAGPAEDPVPQPAAAPAQAAPALKTADGVPGTGAAPCTGGVPAGAVPGADKAPGAGGLPAASGAYGVPCTGGASGADSVSNTTGVPGRGTAFGGNGQPAAGAASAAAPGAGDTPDTDALPAAVTPAFSLHQRIVFWRQRWWKAHWPLAAAVYALWAGLLLFAALRGIHWLCGAAALGGIYSELKLDHHCMIYVEARAYGPQGGGRPAPAAAAPSAQPAPSAPAASAAHTSK